MRKEKRARGDREVIALSEAEEAGRLPETDRRASEPPAATEPTALDADSATGDNTEPDTTAPVFPPGYRVTTDDVRAMQ